MIKVILQRVIAEDLESNYENEIRKTLAVVMEFQGFISATSYIDVTDAKKRTIITNWQNIASWERWYQSERRRETNQNIRLMLAEEENISILHTQAVA